MRKAATPNTDIDARFVRVLTTKVGPNLKVSKVLMHGPEQAEVRLKYQGEGFTDTSTIPTVKIER